LERLNNTFYILSVDEMVNIFSTWFQEHLLNKLVKNHPFNQILLNLSKVSNTFYDNI